MVPISLSFNAWSGLGPVKPVEGDVPEPARWALRRQIQVAPRLLARVADLRDWRHKDVGWGVVLAEGVNIPAALQELIAKRAGPVFRYQSGTNHSFTHLRQDSSKLPVAVVGAQRGTAPDCLPQYLLIYGSPSEVPWQLQYILNANRCVGRLHITGDALGRYVQRLIDGWDEEESAKPNRALVWSVTDPDETDDITHLMRHAIAEPVVNRLQNDALIGQNVRFLDGLSSPTSVSQFVDVLADHKPALIVTTSHGKTGPIDNLEIMAKDLGLMVDQTGGFLDVETLFTKWHPSGAIWYAHACCSAGGDGTGYFADLFGSSSRASSVLQAVTKLGPTVAPLPTALLSADPPIRAFVGHVEPTFDWTLEDRFTGQFLTSGIIEALYSRLFVDKDEREAPISYAFRDWYSQTNGVRSIYIDAQTRFNRGEETEDILLTTQLAGRDIESTVLIGDPTVAMPAL